MKLFFKKKVAAEFQEGRKFTFVYTKKYTKKYKSSRRRSILNVK